MDRRDRGLGQPFSVDGPVLAAILGALDDIHDLLDERLPRPDAAEQPPAEDPVEQQPDPEPEAGPEPIEIKEPEPPKRQARRTTKKG